MFFTVPIDRDGFRWRRNEDGQVAPEGPGRGLAGFAAEAAPHPAHQEAEVVEDPPNNRVLQELQLRRRQAEEGVLVGAADSE